MKKERVVSLVLFVVDICFISPIRLFWFFFVVCGAFGKDINTEMEGKR